jgi:predicted GNAT family acetyltransferase
LPYPNSFRLQRYKNTKKKEAKRKMITFAIIIKTVNMKNQNKEVRIEVKQDSERGAFQLFADNNLAGEMTFVFAGADKFIIDHTEINEAYNGFGYGKMLVKRGVEYARENKLKIIPLCPFAKAEFAKTTEYNDVLA